MKKLFFIPFIFLSSCLIDGSSTELNYNILNITEKNDHLELEILLNRPDLNLKQPSASLSSTVLQEELKVEKLLLNDEICEIDRIPHLCKVEKEKSEAKLVATFKDISLEKKIIIPKIDFSLEIPEIISPTQESVDKTILEFNEVYADQYFIALNTCYSDIDCIKAVYSLEKENSKWEIIPENEIAYYAEIDHFEDVFRVQFNIDQSNFQKIEYEVLAKKSWFVSPLRTFFAEKHAKVLFEFWNEK